MIRTICKLAVLAAGLFSFASEARADFVVLCPSGGVTASWETTGGFGDTGPFDVNTVRALQLFQTRTLECTGRFDVSPTFSYPSNGPDDCGGTVQFTGFSPVFDRNEFLATAKLQTQASGGEEVCTLTSPGSFRLSLTMSEECTPLSAGSNGWSCPDSATSVSAP